MEKRFMEKLSLRPFRDEDLPLFQRWIYREHVAKWFEHPFVWIKELQNRKDSFVFLHHFIASCGEKDIGFCQYYRYQLGGEDWHGTLPLAGTYSIDYLIGEPEYLGKGFGRAMVEQLIGRIRKEPDAKRIIVQPDPGNKVSCGLLLSAGFTYDEKNKLYLFVY